LYIYGTLKTLKVILRGENNVGVESNWGTLYAYMEMLQQNPLYRYYILIKIVIVKNTIKKLKEKN
jgi:hypothetical protein